VARHQAAQWERHHHPRRPEGSCRCTSSAGGSRTSRPPGSPGSRLGLGLFCAAAPAASAPSAAADPSPARIATARALASAALASGGWVATATARGLGARCLALAVAAALAAWACEEETRWERRVREVQWERRWGRHSGRHTHRERRRRRPLRAASVSAVMPRDEVRSGDVEVVRERSCASCRQGESTATRPSPLRISKHPHQPCRETSLRQRLHSTLWVWAEAGLPLPPRWLRSRWTRVRPRAGLLPPPSPLPLAAISSACCQFNGAAVAAGRAPRPRPPPLPISSCCQVMPSPPRPMAWRPDPNPSRHGSTHRPRGGGHSCMHCHLLCLHRPPRYGLQRDPLGGFSHAHGGGGRQVGQCDVPVEVEPSLFAHHLPYRCVALKPTQVVNPAAASP
jgi:hypothetical protein